MAWVWFLVPLAAAVAVMALIRRRYSPRRTTRRLLVPTALVERACSDALGELSEHPVGVFTNVFEPACVELTRVSWADVAALGPQALLSHRTLVRVIDHWNESAGSLQPGDDVRGAITAAHQAACGLLGALPPSDVEAAHSVLEGRVLHSVVATPPEPDVLLN